jgi:hypothetical protein
MFVPQLSEKTQQNLEFPKYHIVTPPPPTIQETFGEQGRNYPGVCDTPNLHLIGYICTISSGEFWKYLSVSDWKVIVVGEILINLRKFTPLPVHRQFWEKKY